MTMLKFRNRRTAAALAIVCVTTALGLPATAQAAGPDGRSAGQCTPGAPGIGDPHYPSTATAAMTCATTTWTSLRSGHGRADGPATIIASATQPLCSFNLDLAGLTVARSGSTALGATWTPQRRARHHPSARSSAATGSRWKSGTTACRTNSAIPGAGCGPASCDAGRRDRRRRAGGGRRHGSPSTTTRSTRPGTPSMSRFRSGYEVVATACCWADRTRGWTTWRWGEREPMASYLATVDIGFWDVAGATLTTACRSTTRSTPQSPAGCGL